MPFIYFGQGVSSQYQDFTERLMSHLALKGTEITKHQALSPSKRANWTSLLRTRMSR